MNILDCIEIWIFSLRSVFEGADIVVHFDRTIDQRPKAAVYFNLRRGETEADLVVWESGEGELSTIESDGTTKQEHFDNLLDIKELTAVLSRVAKIMRLAVS